MEEALARRPLDRPLEPPAQEGKKEDVGVNRKKLDQTVEKLNQAAVIFATEVHFRVHDSTKRVMVQVVDIKSGEVVKEIPPKKLLDVLGAIQEHIGVLFDELY